MTARTLTTLGLLLTTLALAGCKSPIGYAEQEVRFRYKAEDLVPDGTPEAEVGEPYPPDIARRCFAILQALRNHRTMTKWVDLKGPTKTSYVYQLQG